MEFEFDKEIDALLRRTAKGEIALAGDIPKFEIHPDADEIAAFAENALPEKAKIKYTAHFADCDRCRTILSNLIALDSETEIKAASLVAAPQIAEARPTPWYRKLFAHRNLAYTMGALIVLFGGFFAFLVVRNADQALNSADVSQISENQRSAGGPNSEAEPEFAFPNASSNAMSNAMSSNTASANTSSNMTMSNAASTAVGNAAGVSSNAAMSANANSTPGQTPRTTVLPPAPTPENAQAATTPARTETFSTDAAGSAAARISESEKKNADQSADAEEAQTARAAPRADSSALSARKPNPAKVNDSASPKAKSQSRQSSGAESRQIGGKTFTRKEGVWYDASYSGQTTTNVSRGSGDYQKLDEGLRSITGNLMGTVVVVWKNKAYRIQ